MTDPTYQRANDRHNRAIGSIVVGVVFQASYVLAQFIILAVLIREVGEERFGMWVTIFSMTMWLSILPLGMDRTLLTRLGQVAFHQPAMARRIIIAAVGVVVLSSSIAAILIGVFGWSLPWAESILNVTGELAIRDAVPTAVTAMLVTALAIPLMLSGFVLQAYQRGATRHLLGIISQLTGLGLVLLGVWLDWPLPWLGVMIVSPLVIGGALQWIVAWRLMPPRSTPKTEIASETNDTKDTTDSGETGGSGGGAQRVVRPMLATGMGLWLADIAMILLVNSGALVVAQVNGAAAVVPYGAVYRLVGPIFVCYVVIAHSYWPAFGDAARAQDHQWIGKAMRHSMMFVVGLWLLGAAACLTVGEPFIVWWLGEEARPGTPLILAALAFALANGIYHISVAALAGMGYIKVQTIVSLGMLGVYCLATWLCADSLNAIGVMLLQAAGIALIGIVNAAYLMQVMRRPTTQTP